MKYEQKSKSTSTKVPTVKTAPENVINVTIIQESCKKIPTENQPTKKSKAQGLVVQLPPETESKKSDASDDGKSSKNLIRLSKHIKTKNPKIVYKKGVACGVKGGMLVRNTPTDLYKKYQDDWHKFKSYIPGENSRTNLRRSVRRKMQHKDDDDGKVSSKKKKKND